MTDIALDMPETDSSTMPPAAATTTSATGAGTGAGGADGVGDGGDGFLGDGQSLVDPPLAIQDLTEDGSPARQSPQLPHLLQGRQRRTRSG